MTAIINGFQILPFQHVDKKTLQDEAFKECEGLRDLVTSLSEKTHDHEATEETILSVLQGVVSTLNVLNDPSLYQQHWVSVAHDVMMPETVQMVKRCHETARIRLTGLKSVLELKAARFAKFGRVTLEKPGKPQDSLKNTVYDAFSFMLKTDPRTHKQILAESDFENLVKWVTQYLETGSVPTINKPIRRVNTAKTNVVFTFKILYKDLHPTAFFPESLFDLIRVVFYQFRDDNMANLRKVKQPQYYDEITRKK